MREASGTKAIVAIKEEVRLREWQRVYEEWRVNTSVALNTWGYGRKVGLEEKEMGWRRCIFTKYR